MLCCDPRSRVANPHLHPGARLTALNPQGPLSLHRLNPVADDVEEGLPQFFQFCIYRGYLAQGQRRQ